MRPEFERAIKARTELAARLYVSCLQAEPLNKWPDFALDSLAKDCARAALQFSMAEALICLHFHKLEQEAKDGQPEAH